MRRLVHPIVASTVLLVVACAEPVPTSSPSPARFVGSPTPDQATVGASGGIDPLYPTLGNGGYDVGRYEIAIEADPATNDTRIGVRVEATATQDLTSFSLDYSGLAVSGVELGSGSAGHSQADGKLTISPATPIENGTDFVVSIEIAGRPIARGGAGWTWREGEQISAFGLYDAVPSWLPVNADPADKAIIEFRVSVPRPYVAVAPGVPVGTTDVDEGREFHWRAGPNSSFTLAVREYEAVDLGQVAGIPVVSYQPPDLADRQAEALDVLPAMLEYFVDRYGPYPFDGLNLVWVHGGTDLRGPDEGLLHWGPDRRDPQALAHHLTHLWFQVNVTPRTAHESYLRSAFANYGDLLWIEESRGAEARDGVLALWHSRLRDRTDPPADPSRAAGNAALFSRGALSLHALRRVVGDETFFDILRTWVERFHRDVATVDDFVALAEEVAGRQLDEWETGWLRREAVPPRTELGLPAD